MILFHIPTAFLIVGLLYLVMPTVTWVVLSNRRSPGVALWCGGDISFGLGVILLGLRGHVPEWATFPLANLLMFIAVIQHIQSLRLDLAVPWRTMWMVLAALLYMLGFEGIRRGLDDALLRLQYNQSIWVVMYGYIAVLAWRIGHLERSRSARWIAGVLLLLAVAFIYSVIRISIGLSPPDPLNSNPSNIFLALAGTLSAVIGNIAYVGLAFERSQRRTAEAERQYQAIIETTMDGFYSCDVDGRFTDVNRAFCDMLGYTREELLCMKVHDVEANETADEIAAHVQHIMIKGSDRFETRYRCKDGRLLDVELSVNFLPTNAVKIQVFTRDITERKRMEHELSDSEARYRGYFELPLTGRAVTSPSTGWLDVNATLCDMLGYTKTELTQLNWAGLTHPEDLAADLALFKRVMDGKINGYTLEKRFVHKDGHSVQTHLAVHCIRKPDQSVDYLIALILDITDQKRTEQALRESNARYDELVRRIPVGVYTLRLNADGEARFQYASEKFCQMLGLTEQEVLHDVDSVHDLIHPDDRTSLDESNRIAAQNLEPFRWEGRCLLMGETRWLRIESDSTMLTDGNSLWNGVITDISERKQAEALLRESETLLREALEFSPIPLCVADNDGNMLIVNRQFTEVFGYTLNDIPSIDVWMRHAYPNLDYRTEVLALWSRDVATALQNGTATTLREYKVTGKNGTQFDVEITSKFLGNISVASFNNLTEHNKIERELRASREVLREMSRVAKVGGWNLDLRTHKLTWTEEVYRIREVDSNYQPQLEEGINAYPPDARKVLRESIECAVTQGVSYDLELPFITAKGNDLWVRTIGNVEKVNGQIVRLYGIFQDITERKATERQLLLTQFAMEQFADEVYIIRDDISFEYVNDAVCRMLEYGREELMTMNLLDIDPFFNNMAEAVACWQAIKDAGSITLVSLHRSRSGRVYPVEIHNNFIEYEGEGYVCSISRDITERKQTEKALRESEEKYRILFEQSPDSYLIFMDGKFVDCNRAAEIMLRGDRANIIGKTPSELSPEFQPDGRKSSDAAEQIANKILRGGLHTFEWVHRRLDGSDFPVEISVAPIMLNGKPALFDAWRDITERKLAEIAILESEEKFKALADTSPLAIYMSVGIEQKYEYINQTALRLFGYTLAETPTVEQWWPLAYPDEAYRSQIMEEWQQKVEYAMETHSEIEPMEVVVTCKDGSHKIIQWGFKSIGKQNWAFGLDLTERKRAEDEIKQLAFYDLLTQLPNRRLLLDRLHQAMVTCVRSKLYGALLFIDLDNFKTLNDTLGHDQGDLLLQEVANRLLACVRECDTVARLGGDEFVVMLMGLDACLEEAATHSQKIGMKILDKLNQKYQLTGHEHYCSASIGINLFDGHSLSVNELMKQADIALYQAKSDGRNVLRFFDPAMQSSMLARVELTHDLRLALAKNQFNLFCQIEVGHDKKIIGVEVLLRWQHHKRGLILPNEFISLAEETGLIQSIGHWVLESASAALKSWETLPHLHHAHLAVNISVRQFQQANFVAGVLEIVRDSGIDPHKLMLELTENVVLADLDDAVTKMNALKDFGLRFSLDDFGTGYSSLAYLTRLPFDQLKIDRSFVQNIGIKPSDAIIIQTIIAMASQLGIDVIAEGVETETQRDFLYQQGCPVCQGYLFGKPMPLADLNDTLLSP